MGTAYKSYWLTDIPTKRFSEVSISALNRYGWKIGMVNDEIGNLTANKADSKDIMGKWWKFEFRAGVRWTALKEEVEATINPNNRVLQTLEDVLVDVRQFLFKKNETAAHEDLVPPGQAWWDVKTTAPGGLSNPSFLDGPSGPPIAVNPPPAKPAASKDPPGSLYLVNAEGVMETLDLRNAVWTDADIAKYLDGCLVELEVAEDQFGWSKKECQNWFKTLLETTWLDGRKYVKQALASKNTGARWATPQELQEKGYLGSTPESRSLLISRNAETGDYFRLSEPDTNRHALVCGPTGTGKTSSIFVPNLIERIDVSAIVTEATGSKGRADLYSKTAGYREKVGQQKIFYFNPDDMTSNRINPLDQVNSYREARRVTEIIMQSTTLSTHKGDQTWDMAERLLLTAVILHAVGEREDTSESQYGNCNLGYVVKLLNKGAEELGEILAESNILEARESYQGFLRNSSENYRNLVAGGLITRLDLWKDPKVKVLTETTDIDFDSLANELFTWYLATPADQPELKPVAALIFNIALKIIGNSTFKHPIMLMLDEFTNFGYVRGMPAKLTIIRHDKIPCVLGIQDYTQLKLLYHDEAPLFLSQPGTRIFFRPNDHETAERISKGLGEVRENIRKVETSGAIREEKDRYFLLSLDDLVNLDPKKLIAFTPTTRPYLTEFMGWECYSEQTNEQTYPPPTRTAHHVVTTLTDLRKQKPKLEPQPKAPPIQVKAPTVSKHAVPTNPLLWAKEIKIDWPAPTGTKVYNPYVDLKDLDILIFAFEEKDDYVVDVMTEADYFRVLDWVEQREKEKHGELMDETAIEEMQQAIQEQQTANEEMKAKTEAKKKVEENDTKDKDDDFRGAW